MKRMTAEEAKNLSKKLMQWEKENPREMPWKGEKDPYKIWLSEIILQQTRVEQGKPYYERFISKYPTLHALAEAPEQEAFRLWQGLGYYNRCKNMLAAARKLITEYQGAFPDTYEEMLALPGVGEYTAAAIASFAYGLPYAVVDGNVQRVLARYFGIRKEVNSTSGKKYFAALANELLDKEHPGAYNQAIMDFGATVCTPQQAACAICPLHHNCYAFRHQLISVLPVKTSKARPRTRYFHYVVLCYRSKVYLHKRKAGDIWQNLHEFILCEGKKMPDEKKIFRKNPVASILDDNTIKSTSFSETYRQQLTHQLIYARFVKVDLVHPVDKSLMNEYFPVPISRLDDYAFPRIIVRYLRDATFIS